MVPNVFVRESAAEKRRIRRRWQIQRGEIQGDQVLLQSVLACLGSSYIVAVAAYKPRELPKCPQQNLGLEVTGHPVDQRWRRVG